MRQVLARIAAISDLDRLNLLTDRVLDATTWGELFPPTEYFGVAALDLVARLPLACGRGASPGRGVDGLDERAAGAVRGGA